MQQPESGMHMVYCIGAARIFDWGREPIRKSHLMTSSKILEKRNFVWDKNERSEAAAGLARNPDFVEGEELEPKVIKFYGSGGKDPSRWAISCIFWKNIAILMPFGSHFSYFQTHLKKKNL